MIDDQVILTIERLRDRLGELRSDLKRKYGKSDRQVTSDLIRAAASEIAEAWMVDIAVRPEIARLISSDYLADLNVHFQRLLTLSEHASLRSRYEREIKSILRNFTVNFIIPLKQQRVQAQNDYAVIPAERFGHAIDHGFSPTAFVGMSFMANDKEVNDCVIALLTQIGISVVTGEKPKAERISEKVKEAIDNQYMFVGIFTCRDKIVKKNEWTTSPWVIDEKAYAVGKGKRLILLKEKLVGSIGGIQGDYEYIEFSRDHLEDLVLRLLSLFNTSTDKFRS